MITQYELPLLGCKVILANSYDSELSISYLRHRLTSKNTNQKTFLMLAQMLNAFGNFEIIYLCSV